MEEEIIINQILENAQAEANKILAEAVQKAKELEEKNEKLAYEQAEQEFNVEKSKVLKLVSSELEKAEFESRSAELVERKRMIEIVKEKVKQKIADLESGEYVKIIEEKINQYKNEENVEVVLPEKCYETLSKIAEENGMRVVKSDEFDYGVIVRCGKIEYNYDFEENMLFNNEKIEKWIDELLFN